MTTKERDLLDRAITTLICALAHDAAVLHGKGVEPTTAVKPAEREEDEDEGEEPAGTAPAPPEPPKSDPILDKAIELLLAPPAAPAPKAA